MAKRSGKGREEDLKAVERALDVLREDPPRLRRLLRETAGLADDLAQVFDDAEEPTMAGRATRLAKALRGGALLPAALSVALLRKTLTRLAADED